MKEQKKYQQIRNSPHVVSRFLNATLRGAIGKIKIKIVV